LLYCNEELNDDNRNITDALDLYLRLKGKGKDKILIRTDSRNIEYIIKVLGNKFIKHLFNIF
jgi:hypothetical protein